MKLMKGEPDLVKPNINYKINVFITLYQIFASITYNINNILSGDHRLVLMV